MDWTAGYITSVDYQAGYYHGLNPALLRLACLNAGIRPPQPETLHYLELGCGQGVTLNVNAAGFPGVFWGNDFIPTHAAYAQEMASVSGNGAILLDDSFEELAARSDLPQFDMIVLHGVWSWVSDENCRTIVDIIRRNLKVGGLVYISYNTRTGWGPAEPLRDLIKLYVEMATAEAADTFSKIEGALGFSRQLAGDALYFKANSAIVERLERLSLANRSYLAHELLNDDWHLVAFPEICRSLDAAKLSYVASAFLLDHFDVLNLPPDGGKMLSGIGNTILREAIRDYFVRRDMRRDIFVKGPRKLTPREQSDLLSKEAFVLMSEPRDIPMMIRGALGEVSLQGLREPLLEALADDSFAPKSIGELSAKSSLARFSLGQLAQALLLLTGAGHAFPAQVPSPEAARRCGALNRFFLERNDVDYLASPVTGATVPLSSIHQHLLQAADDGHATVADQVEHVRKALSVQGRSVAREGKALEDRDEIVRELTGQAILFNERRLPLLRALGVAIART